MDLHAERIGHGFHLFSADLITGIKDQEAREAYVKSLVKYVNMGKWENGGYVVSCMFRAMTVDCSILLLSYSISSGALGIPW